MDVLKVMKTISAVTCAVVASVALGGSVQGPAPGFSLPTMGGESLALDDLRGQVVMINFWATWCAPCRKEMPLLDQLYKRYSKLGFTLVGVNVEEDPSGAGGYLEETPVSFPILFDAQNQVSELYDVNAMPTTVLVDRQGNMRFLHKGYKAGDEDQYQNWIRALIRER